MRFEIRHEIRGRLRVRAAQGRMSARQADILQYYLTAQPQVTSVKVRERIQEITVCYKGGREDMIALLKAFRYEDADVPESYLQNSGRELNREYWDRLVTKVVLRAGNKLFVPAPVRAGVTVLRSVRYIWHGIDTLRKGKIEVPVLDATAIGVSVARGNFDTAGSVMFLLGIGGLLEEWTHKKSVEDLARSMSLNVSKVWLVSGEAEVLVPAAGVRAGDQVRVHVGNVIPFDGTVTDGEAMVNQASLTGESMPVRKAEGATVYAGTVVEEGSITLCVREANGSSKFEKIVTMIEESEKLKSSLESRAEHLADRLVPWTLAGTAAVWLLTRNVTRALSVLMVDFSCALKLAMPISVLSAIREASLYNVTVKGGKYLEAMAEAKTIVFDKTGTLTKAQPKVVNVVPFTDKMGADELLRIAACLEEHFPHSMAKAVVDAARERNLVHEEMHTQVEYIVAHGISTTVEGKRAVIGSYHFVFEDEKCRVEEHFKERFDELPQEYSHLYLAVGGQLAAVICISDPLREEAKEVLSALRALGITSTVMLTGDSYRTAAAIAAQVGVDDFRAGVLPADKAEYVARLRREGHTVLMVGDGINDSPALSEADAGIAISDGAAIAREIADITIAADSLWELVELRRIAMALMARIHSNYRFVIGFNGALIALGVAGVLPPATSATLHNLSTLGVSLRSMGRLTAQTQSARGNNSHNG